MSMDLALFARTRAVILDDDPLMRDRLQVQCRAVGLSARTEFPDSAVLEMLESTRPDLLLIGREVQGRAGVDVVRAVREHDPEHWIPILMLGIESGSGPEADALTAGCDDYVGRFFVPPVFFAKIGNLLRMRNLRRVAEAQRQELASFRDRAEAEADLARFLLSRLSRVEQLDQAGVAYHCLPAEGFSGDLLAATRSTSGDLYGLLADATGHGLAAAINLIPLSSTFYSMAKKGFNLLAITGQLNHVVKEYSLPDRFVAATLVRFSARERRMEVVNAGNPPALLIDPERKVLREISSGSLPLGIVAKPQFRPRLESIALTGGEELLVYSDGVVEAVDFNGRPFGSEALLRTVKAASRQADGIVLAVEAALTAHCVGIAPADDVSLMVLSSKPGDPERVSPGAAEHAADIPSRAVPAGGPQGIAQGDKHCAIEMAFSSNELKSIDVVPVIVDLSRTIGIRPRLESNFFTILSELYANALEHGVLGLDSSIKDDPDGFERYFGLRQERLAALEDGEIRLRVDHWYAACGGGNLRIEVHDSGPGFDHARWLERMRAQAAGEPQTGRSGRGLALLHQLCDRMAFNEHGNAVVIEFGYT